MKPAVVEIVSDKVESRSGTNERGFWSIRSQDAFLHQGDPYPLPFKLQLPDGVSAYSPGRYVFGAGAFRLGRYGLELSRSPSLVPAAEAVSDLSSSKVRAA